MPSFLDLLWSPIKMLTVLFGLRTTVVGLPAAQASASPRSGFLCSVVDLGQGQLSSVCQVGEYSMPAFVFWASLAIFGLFVYSAFRLTRECRQVSTTLKRLASKLENLGEDKNTLEASTLPKVREALMAHEETRSAWRHFETTLLVEDRVFATVEAENVFSKKNVVDDHVHLSFYESVPSILTGLGLLMTFVAILDGLARVTVSTDFEVTGIAGLINGLSGKFVSSIVALSCSVAFVLVEKFAYREPERSYRRLIRALSLLFHVKRTEHMLQEIYSFLQKQSRAR